MAHSHIGHAMSLRYVPRQITLAGENAAARGEPITACPVFVPAFGLAWRNGWRSWHTKHPLYAVAPTDPATHRPASPGELPILDKPPSTPR